MRAHIFFLQGSLVLFFPFPYHAGCSKFQVSIDTFSFGCDSTSPGGCAITFFDSTLAGSMDAGSAALQQHFQLGRNHEEFA
jgi:hypothetical protein